MTGWNLPPGVTESMLPGNRPEDIEFDDLVNFLEEFLSNNPEISITDIIVSVKALSKA
jgi:hypothetical protein